jgi:hypothetical protein
VDAGRDRTIELTGTMRASWTDPEGRSMVGFEFDEGQFAARAALTLVLFGAESPQQAAGAAEPVQVPAAANDLVAASSAA